MSLHLKDELQDGVAFITLWGGPVRVQADNIHPDDQASVDDWCATLTRWSATMRTPGRRRRPSMRMGVHSCAPM